MAFIDPLDLSARARCASSLCLCAALLVPVACGDDGGGGGDGDSTTTITITTTGETDTETETDSETDTDTTDTETDTSEPVDCAARPEATEASWEVLDGIRREGNPDAQRAELDAFVDAELRLSLDLYKELSAGSDNVMISPISIRTAMTMAYAAARGNTAAEMAPALHLDTLADDRQHVAANRIQLDLDERNLAENDDEDAVELALANSVWLERTFVPEPAYIDLLSENYGVGLSTLDFIGANEAAREVINCWTSARTRDRIQDLFPEGSITPSAVTVLVNALYLKAPWESGFDADSTVDQPFVRADSSEVDVPMMHQLAEFPYYEAPGVQALELPFRGGDLSMVLVVPEGDLATFEAGLDADGLNQIYDGLAINNVDVTMPTFQFRYGSVSLTTAFMNLGVSDAFQLGIADFSGLSGDSGGLFIHDVLHQTFIAVDEDGTEAAAAAGVIIGGSGTTVGPEDASFSADHPFMVIIRDRPTGSTLFLGRVHDPSAS